MPPPPDRLVPQRCAQRDDRPIGVTSGDKRVGQRGVAHHLVAAEAEPATVACIAVALLERAEREVVGASMITVVVAELEARHRVVAERAWARANIEAVIPW